MDSERVRAFIHYAVKDVVHVVTFEHARDAQVVFKSPTAPSLNVRVSVTLNEGVLSARISGMNACGGALEETTLSASGWLKLVERVQAALPVDLTFGERIDIELSGTPAEGKELLPAIGNSDEGRILQVSSLESRTVVPPAASAEVTAFLRKAVDAALEYVVLDPSNRARICLTAGDHWPVWINIDRNRDEGRTYTAFSNDGDLFVAAPPTVFLTSGDVGDLLEQLGDRLSTMFAGHAHVSVTVFRIPASGCELVLEGDCCSGELKARPIFDLPV